MRLEAKDQTQSHHVRVVLIVTLNHLNHMLLVLDHHTQLDALGFEECVCMSPVEPLLLRERRRRLVLLNSFFFLIPFIVPLGPSPMSDTIQAHSTVQSGERGVKVNSGPGAPEGALRVEADAGRGARLGA